MLVKTQDTLSCDVLVIGGGGAGLRAAIVAKSVKADVLVVSKTKLGPGSNTYISKAVIAATGWGTPEDDVSAHFEDTVQGGRFLNDPSMVLKVAERSHSEITFLQDCGVQFSMRKGKPRVIKIPGHRFARHVYGADWSGRDLAMPLKRRAERIGVRFLEHLFVTRLITDESRIRGAAGITLDGRFFSIHAKTVVLATGGYAQIFMNTNNAPGITGDGQAMAYDLGVPLKDMEFVQFYPTAAGKRGNRLILYEKILAQPGAALCNNMGQNILRKHGYAGSAELTRDRLAQLITDEIVQDDSFEQRVFMDLRALSEKAAEQLAPILPSTLRKGKKMVRVSPTAHFCMGGIVTDRYGETSLKGLFAVGEAAAGVHGANRLGGNALAEVFALGSWVGEMAAKRSLEIETASAPVEAFEREARRLEGFYSAEGRRVKQLIDELKLLMWTKVGVIRRKRELQEALDRLRESFSWVAVSNNRELIRLLEYKNMRCAAELVCRAALERSESRGSHFRSDYPAENDRKWLKNIVLRKSGAGVSIETVPVDRCQSAD